MLAIIVLEQRRGTVVQRLTGLSLTDCGLREVRKHAYRASGNDTYPVKEDGRLTKDVASLDQFPKPLAEKLVALVHLHQPRLMLGELDVQFVDGLRSARADSDEGGRVVQRAYGNEVLLLLNLALEEADAAGHLVDAANLTDEGALERIDIGIQLRMDAIHYGQRHVHRGH